MTARPTTRVTLLLVCGAGLLATAAWGAEPAAEVVVGVGGRYRAGSWAPLAVSGVRPGDVLHAAVQDPDGEFVRSPAAVASGSTVRFQVRVGRPVGRLRLENVTTGTAVALDLPSPLPATSEVWLLLGDLPSLGRAARLVPRTDGARPSVIAASAAALAGAGSARDLDGIDTVVACGHALESVAPDVLAGVDAWIREGGRLVLAAGASAIAVSERGGAAAGWLPGPVAELVPLRRCGAVEAYARASGLLARPGAADLRVPLLENRASLEGAIDVFEGNAPTDLPLVVSRAHGLGTITWVALDIDAEPFRGWTGTDTLLVRLLGGRATATEGSRPAAKAGPPDLAGQLRLALEQPGRDGGIKPVSFAVVAGLGLLYVACIFPLEWWIVARTGRPWLAWLTLPALVGAFTAAAGAAARGRHAEVGDPGMRAAEVVDVDATDGGIRARAWLAVWRPGNESVDVAVAAGTEADAAVSWFADAGTGFGAIDAVVAHPTLAAADYAYGDSLAALTGISLAAGSTRLFEAGWSGRAGGVVTTDLVRDGQGTLRGSFAHHLPFVLTGCRLAHGGWLYDVGTLAPDERHDLASGRGPRSLAGALARRDAVRERQAVARWDRAAGDIARILEVAGFHAAAGGVGYTGLESGRLGRLDLSPLLPLDRAVLVGTAADPPAGWTTPWQVTEAGGGTAARTPPCAARLYRIVIPLGASAPRAPGAAAE